MITPLPTFTNEVRDYFCDSFLEERIDHRAPKFFGYVWTDSQKLVEEHLTKAQSLWVFLVVVLAVDLQQEFIVCHVTPLLVDNYY